MRTQTVFGEGPLDASIMFVGEQPGDQEDLAGRPFVGPAGQLFDAALEKAGIDRSSVYVTNAVKHFKFVQRGKKRIHSKPGAGEIEACRWWIEQERELIRPPVTVALGATAARSLFGKTMTIGKNPRRAAAARRRQRMLGHRPPQLPAPHPGRRPPPRGTRAVRPRPQAHQGARGGACRLEAIAERRSDRSRRAGRDVVVGIGGREIMRAEDVLDVDLRLDAARQLVDRAAPSTRA